MNGEEIFFGRLSAVLRSQPSSESLDHAAVQTCEEHALEPIIDKRFPHQREKRLHDLSSDCRGIVSNFFLRVFIHSQRQKMQQVMQVDLPVGFGVGGKRQVFSSLFACDALADPVLVQFARGGLKLSFARRKFFARSAISGAPLPWRLVAACVRHSPGGVLCVASIASE